MINNFTSTFGNLTHMYYKWQKLNQKKTKHEF